MIDSPYLSPFDIFQQLVLWLGTSMRTSRKGRRLLESNQVLLRKETDKELERLITADVEGKVEVKQQMQHHQELLRMVRMRGGSPVAIREAYINIYGGFALDLPSWLEHIEQQRALLIRLQRPERTAKAQLELLYEAQVRAQLEPELAPEIVAEIVNELGHTLLQGTLPNSHAKHLHQIKEAIACHEFALTVYTYASYPVQYARTCTYLGTAYQQYGYILHSRHFLQRGLAYYRSAQSIYTCDESPEQWGMLQTLIGNSYALSHTERRQGNLDQAVLYHKASLQVLAEEKFPVAWARTQVNLGDTYQRYEESETDTYLEQALSSYCASLRIYTKQNFPREWADVHTKLANAFQRMENKLGKPQGLGRTLVCYESALQVYTIDAYPIEYAATQFQLGRIHHQRPDGELKQNLKQALHCYWEARSIFTETDFPTENAEITQYLSQAQKAYVVAGRYSETY